MSITSQKAEGTEHKQTTLRLRIDRMPKPLVRLSDDRTIALLWGRELGPNDRPLGFRGAKLWNRAGETLLKIMKARGVSTEAPITVDLSGSIKIDKHNQRENFEASFFKIVGDPERSVQEGQKRGTQPQRRDPAPARDRQTAALQQASSPAKSRQKREFEHDLTVTGILDHVTGKDGTARAELVAMKRDEWQKATPEERDDDTRMFKVVLAGDIARLHAEIEQAAAWNGPYMDVSQPVVIRAKGTWDKLSEAAAEANGPFRPFIFRPATAEIIAAPNLAAIRQAPAEDARAAEPEPVKPARQAAGLAR